METKYLLLMVLVVCVGLIAIYDEDDYQLSRIQKVLDGQCSALESANFNALTGSYVSNTLTRDIKDGIKARMIATEFHGCSQKCDKSYYKIEDNQAEVLVTANIVASIDGGAPSQTEVQAIKYFEKGLNGNWKEVYPENLNE